MSEEAEMFAEYKEARQEKKRQNKEQSTRILEREGVEFESKNNGVHLIVQGNNCVIDFWPSTGKFITRKQITGRGVHNLLKLCKREAE